MRASSLSVLALDYHRICADKRLVLVAPLPRDRLPFEFPIL